jgi:NodT family efflux transporter outer membrane factor (OMF) lipoprotein
MIHPTHIRAVALVLLLASVAGAQTQPALSFRAEARRAVGEESQSSRTRGHPTAQDNVADFWATLGDTTLSRLVGDALRGNQDVEAVRARVSGARAARTSSLLDLTPAVTAVGGYSRQRLASGTIPGGPSGARLPEQDVWDAGLRMSWDLDVFGQLRNSAQARGALLEAADEDLKDVRVVLASHVARAYFELRGAQDRLAVARRNAENQRGTLEVTTQRLDAGRGTALDVERAQAQLSTTLAGIPGLEAEVAAAQDRIAVLAGREPGAVTAQLDQPGVALRLPDSVVVGAADSVARRRPDVRSAEQQVDASGASVRAARADYLPRLALSGGAGYTSSRFDALGDAGTPRFAIGPVLSWPAFDIARVRANTDAARAVEVEAKARYRQAVLRSMQEMKTSLTTYQKARERLRHLEDAAAASERAAELARLRFTEGASDFLTVLDAERTLLEAQDRLSLGRTQATAALVEVYRATGGAR